MFSGSVLIEGILHWLKIIKIVNNSTLRRAAVPTTFVEVLCIDDFALSQEATFVLFLAVVKVLLALIFPAALPGQLVWDHVCFCGVDLRRPLTNEFEFDEVCFPVAFRGHFETRPVSVQLSVHRLAPASISVEIESDVFQVRRFLERPKTTVIKVI